MDTLSVTKPSIDEPVTRQRVYIVDDDPLVLTAIKDALVSRGYAPITFGSATDLLANVDPSQSGCIISDLQMPGMDGMALQQALNGQDCSMSLIILTAYADVPVTVELMEKGAVTLIEKPFQVEQLADGVKRALQVSTQQHARKLRVRGAFEKISRLTSEEIAVMDCAVQGKSNKATGSELSLSSRTVDRRRHTALQKIDANSISEYAVFREMSRECEQKD